MSRVRSSSPAPLREHEPGPTVNPVSPGPSPMNEESAAECARPVGRCRVVVRLREPAAGHDAVGARDEVPSPDLEADATLERDCTAAQPVLGERDRVAGAAVPLTNREGYRVAVD